MNDNTKQKIKNIIVTIAGVCASLGFFWCEGRIVFHDIPTMIRGYDYVAIETDYVDDYMGNEHQVVTKEAKRKVSFGETFSEFITNFMILTISLGFFIILPSYKDNLDNNKQTHLNN